jgi:AcrR family transcriptional regulator
MNPTEAHRQAIRHKRLDHRLRRAAFRLEMAQVERTWAVVSARREGLSVREIARSVGLSSTRVHQLLNDPATAMLEHALSALRELGWPAPEDASAKDGELVADRLVDEARLLTSCAEWVEQLARDGYPPVINLRPDSDWPDTDNVAVDQARIVRILRRIASDIDELARVRRVADFSSATVDADPRLGRRRRLAEPPIELPKGPLSIPQSQRAWAEYERRLRRAGLPVPPDPWRHLGPYVSEVGR